MTQDERPAYFNDLFERAARALAEHGAGPEAPALHAGPVDGAAAGHGVAVAAQLRIDDRTREVLIRFYDVNTGMTIREVQPSQVAAAAARLRAPIA
jgi:hypothetical protein